MQHPLNIRRGEDRLSLEAHDAVSDLEAGGVRDARSPRAVVLPTVGVLQDPKLFEPEAVNHPAGSPAASERVREPFSHALGLACLYMTQTIEPSPGRPPMPEAENPPPLTEEIEDRWLLNRSSLFQDLRLPSCDANFLQNG